MKKPANILLLPPFMPREEEMQSQEGTTSPPAPASCCTSCHCTQSELQMALGYLWRWSHIRDKQNHSCYCQKKQLLY